MTTLETSRGSSTSLTASVTTHTDATGRALTVPEKNRLAELEIKIHAGLKTFTEVGDALNEISDSRLYREDFGSFAEYAEFVWNMAARTAYQYMDAAKVVRNCAQQGAPVPKNEGQARALSSVPPELQGAVMARAVQAGGEVTAKTIAEAAKAVVTAKPTEPKPISDAKLERAIEKEANRFMDLIESFPQKRAVIIENLRFLLSQIDPPKPKPNTDAVICGWCHACISGDFSATGRIGAVIEFGDCGCHAKKK
jgi:hypothetical protein